VYEQERARPARRSLRCDPGADFWHHTRRFSAATIARGEESQDDCNNVAKEVDHRAILGPVVSQVQPRRTHSLLTAPIEFLRRTGLHHDYRRAA
jgi:hypothetical protein